MLEYETVTSRVNPRVHSVRFHRDLFKQLVQGSSFNWNLFSSRENVSKKWTYIKWIGKIRSLFCVHVEGKTSKWKAWEWPAFALVWKALAFENVDNISGCELSYRWSIDACWGKWELFRQWVRTQTGKALDLTRRFLRSFMSTFGG